jgi:hypothetical protein
VEDSKTGNYYPPKTLQQKIGRGGGFPNRPAAWTLKGDGFSDRRLDKSAHRATNVQLHKFCRRARLRTPEP